MASTVQTNKSPLLLVVPNPIPGPLIWRTGITNMRSEKMRINTWPDLRPTRIRLAYSQALQIAITTKFKSPPGDIPRTTSSAW
jgi:hypothetical protein